MNPFEDESAVDSDDVDIFSDDHAVDDSWIVEHIPDPFSAASSAVLNPGLLFDTADDGPAVDLESLKKTWALSVDQSIVDSVSKDERKRQEAIFELIMTEQTYLKNLQTILNVFYMPLRKLAILPSSDLAAIFLNVESLLVCHVQILSEFEELQRRDKLVIQAIGALFLKHVEVVADGSSRNAGDSLLGYLEYCSNQMEACSLLQTCRQSNQKFGAFLKKAMLDPQCSNKDLSTFLLEPMQRITRYPLLLKQILHYTPKDHRDQPHLLKALQLCENLLSRVNLAAREAESRSKLIQLNSAINWDSQDADGTGLKLDLTSATQSLGARILFHEGVLIKAKSGKRLYGFLFNDMLLLTTSLRENSYRIYRRPLPLVDLKFAGVLEPKGADKNTPVDLAIKNDQFVLSVKFADMKARKTWIAKLKEAFKALNDGKSSTSPQRLKIPDACVGTVSVLIIGVDIVSMPPSSEHVNVKSSVYCRASCSGQVGKTDLKPIPQQRSKIQTRWNQPLLFSVGSIDDDISFNLYTCDKYSMDEPVGESSMQLDFLEYYGDRETEVITLEMRQSEHLTARLQIKLHFKSQI